MWRDLGFFVFSSVYKGCAGHAWPHDELCRTTELGDEHEDGDEGRDGRDGFAGVDGADGYAGLCRF